MDSATADGRLTQLFESYYDEVLAYCARRIGRSEADEAAAEVFAVAWKRIDEVDPQNIKPWLYGVARRVLSNRWRSLRRWSRLTRRTSSLAAAYAESPEVLIIRREDDQRLIDALDRLSPVDQEVLRLTAWEELTAREVAIAIGISTDAAEKRRQRALKRLARILDSQVDRSEISPRAAEGGGG